jgi:outer membrane protein assembly complex protein YaeT
MLLVGLLTANPVAPPGEELLGRTIAEIVVDGDDPALLPDLGSVRGTPLTRPFVRDLIEALWMTDRYRDVRVDAVAVADGVRLVVEVSLRRRLRTLEAEGNEHLDVRELRRIAGFVPDAEEHPDLLEEMRGRVEAAYAGRGYPNVGVAFRVGEAEADGRVTLVMMVEEGEPIRIDSIHLAGNLALPPPLVRRFLPLQPGEPWDQDRVREASRRLEAFYRDQGYFLARVLDPVVEPLESGAVRITLPVEPGLPVRIVFGGNHGVSAEDLATLAAFDENSTFDTAEIDAACDRIAAHYRSLGFPDAAVEWSVAGTDTTASFPTTPLQDPTRWSAGYATEDPFGPLPRPPYPPPLPPQPILELRLRVREGPRMRVARIEWVGADFFDHDALDEMVFDQVAASIDRPAGLQGPAPIDRRPDAPAAGDRLIGWDPEDVYLETAYQQAALRIEARYRSRGFLAAGVALDAPTRLPEDGLLLPRFLVSEGPRSMLRSIAVAGNERLTTEEIAERFLIEEGGPVNEVLVEETRRDILDLYASHGYLYAEVERQAAFSEDRSEVDLRFAVVEGPQVRVAAIEVVGNEETAASLILGSLSFEPGDVFSPDEADASEQRLLRIGIFQGVTIGPAAPEEIAADKVIVVQVRERPPQSLELRAGFSTAEGARAAIGYGYRNLFGYAVGLHLRVGLNYQLFFLGNDAYEREFRDLPLVDQLERHIVAGVNVPYLPGIGSLIATQVDLANERDNEPFYGIDRSSALLGFSTGWRQLLAFGLRGGVEYNDVTRFGGDYAVCTGDEEPGAVCLRPEDARRLRTPQGVSTFGVVRGTASVDWRDDPFNPTRGLLFSASVEWARSAEPVFDAESGVSSFSNLVKASFQLSGYVPLGAGLVLALAGRYGQVFPLQENSRTFPDRYFYLGGFDTLRGFPQESLSVADAPPGFPSPGGNLFLVMRAELRIPLGDAFGTALFTDIGNVWREPGNFDFATLRYAAGAGLRVQTPVGPLALDFGINLDPRDDWNEAFGALHFSIGTF